MGDSIIKTTNLRKTLDNKIILDGISLDLKKGENLGILGKSGVGKSILFKCIVRLMEPDSGEIEVMGQNILDLNQKELIEIRKSIGFLFQGGAIYDSMSVRENLEFPMRRTLAVSSPYEMEERIEKALRSVGLLDSINKMPSELSGGMRKRVALARTLILDPKVILYDEPTTGLDSVTSGEISELILKVQEEYGASSMIITHDMKCAKIVTNRIRFLIDGKFAANGTYEELSRSEDIRVREFFM